MNNKTIVDVIKRFLSQENYIDSLIKKFFLIKPIYKINTYQNSRRCSNIKLG